jgi:hypothetical protein
MFDLGTLAVRRSWFRVLAWLLLVAFVANAPASAQELPTTLSSAPSSPVSIDRCEAWTDEFNDLTIGEDFYYLGVGIKFTNNSTSAITALVLQVSAFTKSHVLLPKFPQYFNTINNRAAANMSVAPGASFSLLGKRRDWQRQSSVFHDIDQVKCTVTSVTFADGSSGAYISKPPLTLKTAPVI